MHTLDLWYLAVKILYNVLYLDVKYFKTLKTKKIKEMHYKVYM